MHKRVLSPGGITFAWFGPGLEGVTSPAAAALFDEELVQNICDKAQPVEADRLSHEVTPTSVRKGIGNDARRKGQQDG